MVPLFHGLEIEYSSDFDHNKFEIFSEELGNVELSLDCIIEKFINITKSITKDLSIKTITINYYFLTDEKLKAWNTHYKFLVSDSLGHSLLKKKNFIKNS